MNVAVVHMNWGEGGGEVVAEALADALNADLYFGYEVDESGGPDYSPSYQLFSSDGVLGRIAEKSIYVRDVVYTWRNQYINELHDYDVVVQSGNEAAWYVPPDEQTVLRYAHSTPRTPFDRFVEEGKGDNPITRAYSFAARTLLENTVNYVDGWIANSDLVARRLRKYWGVDDEDIRVVYPPVPVGEYSLDLADPEEDLFFTWSRLYRSKRIEEIVRAFNEMPDARLIVGGSGPEKKKLEKLANENVEIRGYIPDGQLQELVARSDAVVYNAVNEDFGLVPIEAMAGGSPVIGIDDGFTKYQIEEGLNGYLHDGTVVGIMEAVRHYQKNGVKWSREELSTWAKQFDYKRFGYEIREEVQIVDSRTRIDPSLEFPEKVLQE